MPAMAEIELSIIVPLAPDAAPPRELLSRLTATSGREVIVSAVDAEPERLPPGITWLSGAPGRGRQLNLGARTARAPWLWFLHADSLVDETTLKAVGRFIARRRAAIGYCDLRFLSDGPRAVALNAAGANLRSNLLGLPYGDQGLCLPAEWFGRLGGFREDLGRGEDLDFIVRARRAGLRTRRIGAPIHTSASRYAERGWLRTTLEHQCAAWRLIRNARQAPRVEHP